MGYKNFFYISTEIRRELGNVNFALDIIRKKKRYDFFYQ